MNRTYTTTLPVHTTASHVQLRPTMRDFAHNHPSDVTRPSDDALRMDLVIRRHGGASQDGRFSASGRVALLGRDIHATAVHPDLYTAIVKLVGRLVRRFGARKTRVQDAQASRRVRTNGSRPRYAKLAPARGPSATPRDHASAQVRSPRENTIPENEIASIRERSPAHVLLTIDYGDPAAAVTRTGAALAAKTGARLTLLHVLEPVTHEPDIVAHWIDFPKQRRHYAAARLRSAV
jgi:ribosome-associated translation inhibitor RaiA